MHNRAALKNINDLAAEKMREPVQNESKQQNPDNRRRSIFGLAPSTNSDYISKV